MKKTLIALAATVALSGCAGLSVNFDAAISYRSDVPYGGRKADTSPAAPINLGRGS